MSWQIKHTNSISNETEVLPHQGDIHIIPLQTLPVHIILDVLRRMEAQAWIRTRRTCHFIFDLVIQEQHRFLTKCCLNVLTLQYDPEYELLTIILTEHETGNMDTREEDVTYFAESVLPGLLFDTVNIECLNDDRLFLNEDLVTFEREMRNLTTNVALRCDTLTVNARIGNFPYFVRFFQSVNKITCGIRDDDTDPGDLYEILEILEHPQLKNIRGGNFITRTGCEGVVPLFHRLKTLSLSAAFEREAPRRDIWRNIREMFKEFKRGNFDGQKKGFYMLYIAEGDLYWDDGSWKELPEVEGISPAKIWDYQHPKGEDSNINDLRFVVYLIESNGSVAVCAFTIGLDGSPEYCVNTITVIIRPTYDAEEISNFLRKDFLCGSVDHTELVELLEARDWKNMNEELTIHRKRFDER